MMGLSSISGGSVGKLGMLLAAFIGLIGLAPSLGTVSRLRAGRADFWQQGPEVQQEQPHDRSRSLQSTRSPECTMPVADPCTINTTAIGMIETGYATYYDDTCAELGYNGCFTDGIPSCRTCYLSVELYMDATNATEAARPDWGECPCCVTTTLSNDHPDLEVQIFDYSIFNVSVDSCTDVPTIAPTTMPEPVTPAPVDAVVESPAPALETPAPSAAAVTSSSSESNDPVEGTDAPVAGSRGLETPSPFTTPAPVEESEDNAVGEAAVEDDSDSDSGLSMPAKIGIGAGACAGVIIIGIAGFGAYKASTRGA